MDCKLNCKTKTLSKVDETVEIADVSADNWAKQLVTVPICMVIPKSDASPSARDPDDPLIR